MWSIEDAKLVRVGLNLVDSRGNVEVLHVVMAPLFDSVNQLSAQYHDHVYCTGTV